MMQTKTIQPLTVIFAALSVLAKADVTITYSPAEGIGPETFTESGRGAMPAWGVHIGGQKPLLPFIERIPFDAKSVTPPHNAAP